MKRKATLLALLLLAACATRPPAMNRAWSTHDAGSEGENAVMLTYGAPASDDVDLFAVCDRTAKVFELAFFTGDTSRKVKDGTRTQLLVGPPAKITPLMASVQHSELSGEMMVVARATLPPAFVRDWAGERVTVAGQGTAMTLLVRPDKAMIEDFLARCGA